MIIQTLDYVKNISVTSFAILSFEYPVLYQG